jgi:hypothetical protein
MDKPPDDRRRHLSLVPDLPGGPTLAAHETFRTPGLFVVDPDAGAEPLSAPPPEVVLPAGTTTADLIRGLAELGAPQPFLDHATTFGDDVQALSVWLRDYGPVFSERQWTADLLDRWTSLLHPSISAFDAEIFGYRFLSTYAELLADPEGIGSLHQVISEAVTSRRPEALAMVRVLAHAGPAEIRSAAGSAVRQLVAGGVPDQKWAGDLGSDEFVDAVAYVGVADRQQVLVIQFQIHDIGHYVAVLIDHKHEGGIRNGWSAPSLDDLMGRRSFSEAIAGAQFVRYDISQAALSLNNALSVSPCPADPDQAANVLTYVPLLRARARLLAPLPVTLLRPHRVSTAGLGTHQIKVSLTGIRPPIWRRLQVASSCTLADLHLILQDAFGWTGPHHWVFECGHGRYGDPDPGYIQDAGRFTLADVAAQVGSELSYRYDLRDDWLHSIVVEAVVDAVEDVQLPRCVGGRRAAPPDDCRGPGGYRSFLDRISVVASAACVDDRDDRATSVDTVRFSVRAVNEALGARWRTPNGD